MFNDSAGIRMGGREMSSFDLGYVGVTAFVNMLMSIYVPNILEFFLLAEQLKASLEALCPL